ncbi:TadA family conjugal transfer-associated ATPase [Corynebacterium auriscanis]|uniref:TadA family conjugal transfer-associated ATPase n=1 Tax=Corynebacterium auriscanis TaxID=99807 RepID=UPI003CFA2ECA
MTHSCAQTIRLRLAERGISEASVEKISEVMPAETDVETIRQVQLELSGLGQLGQVLTDPWVTDVVVNADGTVWQDRGEGMEKLAVELSAEEARNLAVHMAATCGTRLDDAMPYADGVLTGLPSDIPATAIRMHAVLSPPVQGGTCISLRMLKTSGLSIEQLVKDRFVNAELAGALRGIVDSRKNVLISGGTGTGKTTLLATLLGEVPGWQRCIVVEDTPELMPEHPHVVSLTARRGNAEGQGAITMQTLVKQCLRMRPDRIVVGEIRGAEVADLLVALNTGHAGSAGTIHANSPGAVPGRLDALGAMAGMPERALARQAADGIDVLLHVARTSEGRKLTHVGQLALDDRHRLDVRLVWAHGPCDGWSNFMTGLGRQAA